METIRRSLFYTILTISVVTSAIIGGAVGFYAGHSTDLFGGESGQEKIYKVNEESAVVDVVQKVSPAVVSITISKELSKDTLDRYNFWRRFFGLNIPNSQGGSEIQEIGGGTGFIVSADGYIVTNKHVVADNAAKYDITLNDGAKYNSKILALDPGSDMAVLKIDAQNLPVLELGDSSNLKVGQTVIAIGNSLGEFNNTVSTGVISGLSRSVTAGSLGAASEQLTNVIQTDASINPGNSGGPLLNIAGQVIGINTAIVQGAQNIGFAIPVNSFKSAIESVKKSGRIIRPWMGVRYIQVNKTVAQSGNLKIDYGVLLTKGEKSTEPAIVPGSPADKAGLKEGDIILELNEQKLSDKNPLSQLVSNFKPGDEISLKIFRQNQEKTVTLKLAEMK